MQYPGSGAPNQTNVQSTTPFPRRGRGRDDFSGLPQHNAGGVSWTDIFPQFEARYAAVRLRRLFFHFDRARGTCETTCRRRLTTTRVCERSRSRRSKHSWKARKQLRQRNQLVGRILRTRLLRSSRGDKRAETRQRCGHAPSTKTAEVCHKAKQHNTRERINSNQNPYVN